MRLARARFDLDRFALEFDGFPVGFDQPRL
jgi:hypothetical protein